MYDAISGAAASGGGNWEGTKGFMSGKGGFAHLCIAKLETEMEAVAEFTATFDLKQKSLFCIQMLC